MLFDSVRRAHNRSGEEAIVFEFRYGREDCIEQENEGRICTSWKLSRPRTAVHLTD